jgi:hypothetical protein
VNKSLRPVSSGFTFLLAVIANAAPPDAQIRVNQTGFPADGVTRQRFNCHNCFFGGLFWFDLPGLRAFLKGF